MQQANGTVILSPENQQFKYGITPGEMLIIKELHFQYSNGTPLGAFFIQDEPAQTVDSPAKPAEEALFDTVRGRMGEAKPAVAAKTHKRTNAEECARLRKKYTGNITKNGVSLPAFAAVFGTQPNVTLPQTFAEIQEIVGIDFHTQDQESVLSDDRARTIELAKKGRPELAEMALGFKLKVHQADSKEFIIAAIINEENKQQIAALEAAGGKGVKEVSNRELELAAMNKTELLELAVPMKLEVSSDMKKDAIIAAIFEAEAKQ